MNGWMYGMYAGTFMGGVLLGMAGLSGCSGKVETNPAAVASVKPAMEAKTDARKFISTEMMYNHALGLFEEGSYDEAEKEFEEVCEKWPKFSKPYKHLARTQIKQGKLEEALENALTASELNPKDGTIDNVIGMALMELDDFDSAEASFRTAISKSPTFSWAYNNLGYLLIRKGDFVSAKDILLEGSKVDNAPAVLFNNLGIVLEKTGDTAGAMEAYAKAVEKDPGSIKATGNLSRLETDTPAGKNGEIAQVMESR